MVMVWRRSDDGSRGWSDVIGGSGQWAKEHGKPLKARKVKETDSSLEHAEGTEPCQYLHFSLVRLVLDFWSPQVEDNKFVLF